MKWRKLSAALLAAAVSLCAVQLDTDSIGTAEAAGTRVSVHDPSIIKTNGTYYVFGSHIDAARSTDLVNWRTFTNGYAKTNNVEFGNLSTNLAKAFAWAGEDLGDCEGGFAVWAPDVVYDPDFINSSGGRGAYLMYFCTSSTWNTSVIAFAQSQNVEGPYTFVDTLIYSGFTSNDTYATSSTKNVNRKYTTTNIDELIASGEVTYNNSWFNGTSYNFNVCPNAIDPTIYYDTDGKMYMVYGSWSGGIFTLEMDAATGKCIHPTTGTTSDGRMVDSYFGTKLAGGYHKSGEGPFIEYNEDTGYYYLWETYGGLLSAGGYNMRVFRSASPTGPFLDPAGKSGIQTSSSNLDSTGLKVMGNYKFSTLNRAYMACGHNSVLRDDDGQWYLIYHARFDDGSEYHEVRVHSMWFNEAGWPVVAPFEYAKDTLAEGGYETSDIVGTYEYINHGTATDGNIINYSSITLNSNGSISGAVTGTWTEAEDSAAATLVIGGQTYYGYFLAAQNESGRKVMSFTAVGSNNQTVWGAKTDAYTGTPREAGSYDYSDSDAQLVYNPDSVLGAGAQTYIGGTSLLSGVSYFISNKNSGLYIDLPNGALTAGTNIQQWELNKSFAQQWRISAVDGNYCRIVSLGDESMCIAVAESAATDGLNVELQAYTGADNQLWKLVKNGMYYGIVSKCSGDTGGLDVYEWSTENGGNINQWNYWEGDCQLWTIEPVHPAVNDGAYTLRNIASGLYFGGSGGETADAQTWQITQNANGTYQLIGSSQTLSNLTLTCQKDGSYALNGDNAYVLEPASASAFVLRGDVDANGKFELADVVMMQKYLLTAGILNDYDMGDMNADGKLNAIDLTIMKRELMQK